MFDAPTDAWYTWLGTVAVATALLGVALTLPTAPPPDAAAAADAIDSVAAASDGASGSRDVAATSVKLSSHAVALRGPGGVAREPLAFGPVTPVGEEGPLVRVLRGTPASSVFDSPSAFVDAARSARREAPTWKPVERIVIRTVVWEGVNVTLVGA